MIDMQTRFHKKLGYRREEGQEVERRMQNEVKTVSVLWRDSAVQKSGTERIIQQAVYRMQKMWCCSIHSGNVWKQKQRGKEESFSRSLEQEDMK